MRNAAVLVLLGLCACAHGATTFSGTIHTETIDVGSKTGGRIQSVRVAAGDHISAGQILLTLDDRRERAAVAQAQATLDQANAQLADAVAGPRTSEVARAAAQSEQAIANADKVARAQSEQIAAARAQTADAQAAIVQAQAVERFAEQTFERQVVLGSTGDVPRQSVDQARSARDQARAGLASAIQRARRANDQLQELLRAQAPFDPLAAEANARAAQASEALVRAGSRPKQIDAARANVDAAVAALRSARVAQEEAAVRAPLDGVVESIDLHPGDLLAPNVGAAEIDSLKDPYVRIYVPQQGITAFTLGKKVTVHSDALHDRAFEGTVEARDRTAQFTPRDVQTAEDRAELTFGIKVRIHDPDHVLYGGTTAVVSLP